MLLEGLFVPLTTPFYPDGRLYLRKLEHNVGRYSKTPAAGLVVLGEAGEAALLSEDEARQVLQVAIEAAADEKVMVAGVSRESVAGTLELARFAAELGYDAVLVEVPWTLGAEQVRERQTYFAAVADGCELPVVVGSGLQVEEIRILSRHGRVIGVLEGDEKRIGAIRASTAEVKREVVVTPVFAAVTDRMLARRGPVEGAARLVSLEALSGGSAAVAVAPERPAIKTRTKVVGFQVLGRGSSGMLEALEAGASGVVPVFAACAPQACYEVVAAWKDADAGLAREKQERVAAAVRGVEGSAGGLKYACDLNGYFGGRPRLPLLGSTGAERGRIDAVMRGIRN